ncbi:MAG: hypothetical protein UY10_C0043G0008 [Microgenomates group bacterium GW2011_GWA2_47_8]|nr:MAG: hypothetical protein UY10_C0043G0008 [Microgenomates group bacterium GW2011_GWA2_47_8]
MNDQEADDNGVPDLGARGENLKAAVGFITAAKNRFKEGEELEEVLEVLNQAKVKAAQMMQEDIETGSNIVFRVQALEQAFSLKRGGAEKSEIDKVFADFDLPPEEL